MLQSKVNTKTLPPILVNDEFSSKDWKKALRSSRKKSNCGSSSVPFAPKASKNEKEKKSQAVKGVHPTAQKPREMKGASQNIEKAEEREQAAKAKTKFLDNLSKFQKESKQATDKSSFQRSSNKAEDKDNFRRSFRVTASPSLPRDPNHFTRQSLRKPRDTETSFNKSSRRSSIEKGNSSIKRKSSLGGANEKFAQNSSDILRSSTESSKSTTSSIDFLEPESFVINSDTMTSSRASSAISTSATSDASAMSRSSGLQRSQSRAEAAMEKHKERMRRASLQTTQNVGAQLPRQQLTPKMKRKSHLPEITKDECATLKPGKPKSMDQDSTETFKGAVKSNTAQTSKTESSIAGWNSIKVVENNHLAATALRKDKVEEQNNFDMLDIRSPMIKRKNPARNNRKQKATKTSNSRSKQQPTEKTDSTKKSEPELASQNLGSNDVINHTRPGLEDCKTTATRASMKDTNYASRETLESNQNIPFKNRRRSISSKKETSYSVEEWVAQQQFMNETSKPSKNKNSENPTRKLSLESPKKLPKSNKSDFLTSEKLQFEEELSNFLPEDPLVLHLGSPTEQHCHAYEPRTKHHAENGASEKYPISGHASETKETKKRNGVKKGNKKEQLAKQTNVITQVSQVYANAKGRGADIKVKNSDLFAIEDHKLDSNGFLSEKLVLDYELTDNRRVKSAPTKSRLVNERAMSASAPVTSRSFRSLSAAQRRAKLRRVLLKYRKDSNSDSPLSEGSGDDSDIDMKWLDDGNDSTSSADIDQWINASAPTKREKRKTSVPKNVTTQPQCNGTDKILESNHSSPKQTVATNEQPTFGNTKSMWESKPTETYKSPRSPEKVELEGIRSKVEEAKAALVSPTKTKPAKESGQSLEKDNGQSRSTGSSASEAKNVTSMLSMWENRKNKQHTSFNATEDEAFDSNTMGRLQGAKALFQRMSLKRKDQPRPVTAPSRALNGRRNIVNVKDVFETKSTSDEKSENISAEEQAVSEPIPSPTIKSNTVVSLQTTNEQVSEIQTTDEISPVPSPEPKPKRTRDLSSGDWLEGDDDLSDAPTLSSATTSEDEDDTSDVKNVRTMWERRASQKESSAPRKDSVHDQHNTADVQGNVTSVPAAWEDDDEYFST